MKQLARYDRAYFARYKDHPVAIKPFNPQTKIIAFEYIKKLEKLLKKWNLMPVLRGSTAWEIAGKGEIEVGVYLDDQNWQEVIDFLEEHYGEIGNQDKEYARFNDRYKGFEVEIILQKGYTAKVDQKLFEFMAGNRKVLKEYEDLKKKYAYSKPIYQYQKHLFFKKIIKNLPND